MLGLGYREQQQPLPPVNEKTNNKPHPCTAQLKAEKENFYLLMLEASLGKKITKEADRFTYKVLLTEMRRMGNRKRNRKKKEMEKHKQ